MKIAVLRFPGANADWDALQALRDVLDLDARYVFHKECSLRDFDAVVLPGGFSYGDYLRPGAIAGFSPISQALRQFAAAGGPVLGICNGFQILTELGLLPGALVRNAHLRFSCHPVEVEVCSGGRFTDKLAPGTRLTLPIAHADGRYHCDAATLAELESQDRIALRYTGTSPNGSVARIAGIYNEGRNVLGLMPHPERACEALTGLTDGKLLLSALVPDDPNAPVGAQTMSG